MKKQSRIFFFALVLLLSGASAFATDMGDVDIHGFISQGYMKSNEYDYYVGMKDGSFQLNEMGINFATKLTKNLRLGMQFFARDIGNIGNDEIVVDWAYADYYYKEWLGFRAGRMKTPMGLYNESRDVDAVRTGVFLPQSVYFEYLRDSSLATNGVGVYGNIELGVLGGLEYQIQAGSNNLTTDSGTGEGVLAIDPMLRDLSSIDVTLAYSGRVKWATPLPGLTLSVSGNSLDMDMEGSLVVDLPFSLEYRPFSTMVYSAEFIWNDFMFATEYERLVVDYSLSVTMPDETRPGSYMDVELADDSTRLMGWYASMFYRFCDWFEGGITYSEHYDNADDMDGSQKQNPLRLADADPNNSRHKDHDFLAWQKEWVASMRFDINPYWIVKLEDHYINGNSQVLLQNADSYEVQEWNMWIVKFTYFF